MSGAVCTAVYVNLNTARKEQAYMCMQMYTEKVCAFTWGKKIYMKKQSIYKKKIHMTTKKKKKKKKKLKKASGKNLSYGKEG